MIGIPTHREPTHPGEMLLEEFLKPMGITQQELADQIHVPYHRPGSAPYLSDSFPFEGFPSSAALPKGPPPRKGGRNLFSPL